MTVRKISDDFTPEVEVVTYNDSVVAVLYGGVVLSFSETDGDRTDAVAYRATYENGDAADVLSVEYEDKDEE